MDLFDQMKTFTRIVETGQLQAAAKSRRLSVAAVSRQLAALEAELGTTLLLRSSRKLAVTDSGRKWYASCARILQELETARSDVAQTSEVSGSVVISAPISFALFHLLERIEKLSRAYPALSVELRMEDQAVDLLATGVDIAIRVGMTLPDSASVVAHKLLTFRRKAFASPAYLRKRGTPKHPTELAQHDLLAHARAAPSFTRWVFAKGDETVEVTPPTRLLSSSPVVLQAWAAAGAGIALIPPWLQDGVKVVLPDWQTPAITAFALHRAEVRGVARIKVALAALAEGMADLA